MTRVEEKHQDHDRQLSAMLEHHGQAGGDITVIAAMDPGATYEVTWNGQPVDYYERYPGALEMTLDSHPNGKLKVVPKGIDKRLKIEYNDDVIDSRKSRI